MIDICNDIDRRMMRYVDRFGIKLITNQCIHHASVIDVYSIIYTKTHTNLMDMLGRYNYTVSDLVPIDNGDDSIICTCGEYIVKISGNPVQSLQYKHLLGNKDEYMVDVIDVIGNVIIMERVEIGDELYEFADVINEMRIPNSKPNDMDSKIILDIYTSRMKCYELFKTVLMDVHVSNVGLNGCGNYVIFDW